MTNQPATAPAAPSGAHSAPCPAPDARPAALSLFTGIGGLDLGLERAGMRIVGQVEIDAWCRAVLARHWPLVPRHDDARTCLPWWHSTARPRVHVLAAGFPCQPVSLAGPQRGTDDPRWLWHAVTDVLRDLRPDYALLENVPGLLVRELGLVLGELAEIGYDAEWDCIPAASLGAPHIRDRVFVIAHPMRQRYQGDPTAHRGAAAALLPVADAARHGRQPWGPGDAPQEPGGREPDRGRLGAHVAHADRAGRRPGRGLGRTWPTPLRTSWWATEPDVGRVAHGVPARVDRLRGLGNSVVPHVAEHVGRLIVADFHTTPESE